MNLCGHYPGLRWGQCRSERGFTLIELIMAMGLTTLVVGAVVSMVVSQSRFADRMRSGAMQLGQVRAASNFIATELRDLPRGAVAHAGEDSLTIRLPLSWGVVCGDVQRQDEKKMKKKKKEWKKWRKDKKKKEKDGKPPPPMPEFEDTAAIYMEPLPQALGAPTPEGFGLSYGGLVWELFDVPDWDDVQSQDTTAYTACLGGADSNFVEKNIYGQFDKISTFVDSMPTDGALLYSYHYVSYYFAPEQGDADVILYRGTSDGAQKLAWPFAGSAGFKYRLDNGVESSSVPPSDLHRIRAVQLRLPARQVDTRRSRADTLAVHPWVRLQNSR